jgi:hypothetical protein
MGTSRLLAFLVTLALGWALITWLATAGLARRRGLTRLAAFLDPRSWVVEPVLGLRASLLLLAWGAGCAAATLLATLGR